MALLEKLGFLGGANDAPVYATKEDIEARRKEARALLERSRSTAPLQHWLQGAAQLAGGIEGAIGEYQATKADRDANAAAREEAAKLPLFGGGQVGQTGAATTPIAATGGHRDASTGTFDASVATPFLDTLRGGGITNPNALAAVGATGQRESGWDPKNLNRTWSDPAESGAAGQAGGALSWRADRLAKLQAFAAANGETGNGSPATQAKFFMQEDPALIQRLNASRTPDEAMQHMNNAWRFAGYNREGGEAAARIAEARKWSGRIASADPNFRPAAAPQQMPTGAGSFEELPDGSQRQTLPNGMVQTKPVGGDWSQPHLSPSAPTQVAQVGSPAISGTNTPSLQQLLSVRNSPLFERMPAGTQAVVNSMIQKQVSAETKDPLDQEQKRLNIQKLRNDLAASGMNTRQQELAIQKAEREAGMVDMDRFQDQAGTFWERKKGTTEPWAKIVGPEAKDKKTAVSEVEERKAAADKIGIKPEDPAYKGYIATGRMPREDAQPLTATDKKAIMEADEQIVSARGGIDLLKQAKEVSAKAFDGGPMASTRGYAASLFGSEAGSATTQLDNILTTQSLSQLKAIFGGAPTEGERKILLDIQGASRLPHKDRVQIIDRAIQMAERRLGMNERVSKELREGTYYKKPGDAAPAQLPGAKITTGAAGGATTGPRILSVEPIR